MSCGVFDRLTFGLEPSQMRITVKLKRWHKHAVILPANIDKPTAINPYCNRKLAATIVARNAVAWVMTMPDVRLRIFRTVLHTLLTAIKNVANAKIWKSVAPLAAYW